MISQATVIETAREEERAARAQQRHLEKMHRARSASVDRERRTRLSEAIRRTRPTHPGCRCDLRSGMTRDELVALGSGCCDRFVCPRLDAVRRAVGL